MGTKIIREQYGNPSPKNFLEISEMYFEYLNEKNLMKLEELYSKDIELYDWNDMWHGRQNVLDMNEGLFDSGLEFVLNESKQIGNRTYNHIVIHTNKETIKVLDVIYWNEDFKITKIEAFKGTISLPFEAGSAVAVKIIDDRGIESLRVITI